MQEIILAGQKLTDEEMLGKVASVAQKRTGASAASSLMKQRPSLKFGVLTPFGSPGICISVDWL